jgi:hypothetical protein
MRQPPPAASQARILLLAFATCVLASCSDSTGPAESKKIELTRIGWYFQNSPPDYGAPYSLSLDLGLHYAGSDLVSGDIASATASAEGGTWNLMPTASSLNDSAKTIAYGWDNFYSSLFSSNGSVMPIGEYAFSVKLKNGALVASDFPVPAPGALTDQGYRFVYTEDYTGQVTSAFHPMLRRPAIRTVDLFDDTIAVEFSISDSLAYGGWLWYYDASNRYLGRSEYFRNYSTKAISWILNEATTFRTDGKPNLVRVTAAHSVMNTGETYGSIQSVRVVVTDGLQYANTTRSWDCRAFSPRAWLP